MSPLTRQQEVSAYEGEDEGDNWEVQCLNSKQTHWTREEPVSLIHKATGVFLGVSPQASYGQPIPGQLEVSGMKAKSANTVWLAQEGIYFASTKAK
jgi:dolichyl-phosphate-mannose--protein O-mannosyl transferase